MSMTKKAVLFAAGLVMLAGGTAGAAEPVDIKVPFPFTVQGKALPAGQYRLENESTAPSVWSIQGENGTNAGTIVLTRTASGEDPAGDTPALTFAKYENRYRLTGIWESREQGQEIPPAKHVSTHAVPTHATKGVVKSIDASTLVITRKSKTGGEMTFALDPATHLQGTVAVGTSVDVRYREDGKTYVATAVTAQPSKPQAVHTAAPKP
jgi:uncharacterized protein DUF5666